MKVVRIGWILVVVLTVGVTVSLIMCRTLLNEKQRLEGVLLQTKSELEEKRVEVIAKQEALQRTIEEKESVETALGMVQTKLTLTEEELEKTKGEIDSLNKKIGLLENDNADFKEELVSLKQTKLLLESKLDTLSKEKSVLEAKLHSLIELKKAIKEVKKELFEAKVKTQKEVDIKKLAEGNRGYMRKESRSTVGSKIKVEVLPADL